jgi:hypothetical protein
VSNQFKAICADTKYTKTTNSKFSTKQGVETNTHPPFSPDLASFFFHHFGPLKDALRGRRFAGDDLLTHGMREDLRHFSIEVYATGIHLYMQSWKKCVDNEEDVVKN